MTVGAMMAGRVEGFFAMEHAGFAGHCVTGMTWVPCSPMGKSGCTSSGQGT